jgi:hypothetical protein
MVNICYRLNLTAASRVHLLEPQWNPSIEDQALSRAHRIGQTRPVVTIRYVMENSFEEVRTLFASGVNCHTAGSVGQTRSNTSIEAHFEGPRSQEAVSHRSVIKRVFFRGKELAIVVCDCPRPSKNTANLDI